MVRLHALHQRRRTGRRRSTGQSIMEFAIVVPVLFALLFLAIAAIQTAMAHHTVNHAARAAAHEAAISGGDVQAAQRAADAILDAGLGTSADKATITVTCPEPCSRYSPITISIHYQDALWVPTGVFNEIDFTHSTTRSSEQDRE